MPTALIVEDEPAANELLAMLVRTRGYQTDSAADGNRALEQIGRRPPDVVLLDLMLPDRHGLDVCRAIKDDRRTALIPVVVVSAMIADENEARCFAAGAHDFVPKPYTPDQIFRALGDAEAWAGDARRGPHEGVVVLDPRDRLGPLRELSRLRSLLRARTPLDEGAIAGIADAFGALSGAAASWGDGRVDGPVAEVAFRLEAEGVRLLVRDRAGWFVDGMPPRDPGFRDRVLGGPFDLVAPEAGGDRLTLLRGHPRLDVPSPSA